MTFGEKLKELRENKGLSQREVGASIGVDAAFISKVEKGEKKVSRSHLPDLSNFLKIENEILETLWLADKLYQLIENEEYGHDALREAEAIYQTKKKKP